MKITLVSREYALAKRSRIGSATRRLARALAERGLHVRVVTQGGQGELGTEAAGRIVEHRLALPREPVTWERTVLNFSVEAARLIGDLHARGEVDVVEFPDAEASGAALLLLGVRAVPRPPVVVTTWTGRSAASELEAAERLCLLDADATCRADASPEDRIELYALLTRAADSASRPTRPAEHRARKLDAWRTLRADAHRASRRAAAREDEAQDPPSSPESSR